MLQYLYKQKKDLFATYRRKLRIYEKYFLLVTVFI